MSDNSAEKRKYIRHPSDIPIEIISRRAGKDSEKILSNISFGGLCFKSGIAFEKGDVVKIKITNVRPPFEAEGRVMWCSAGGPGEFDVGVEFTGEGDAFRARMVEQVCRIEKYRQDALKLEGRSLTGSQAALEWIIKYADKFPGK